MIYGSVCSGHCAVSQALASRGWSPAFFAEIEAFPAGVLAHRFGATAPRHQLDPATVPAKERKSWIANNRELDRMAARGEFTTGGNGTPNLGDFTKIDPEEWRHLEWLWGGTPCQSFSVAGARDGLKDHRGNLTLAFVGLAHELAATGSLRGFIWENVPGILSHKDNPFGCFLGALAGHDAPIVSPHGKGRWPDAGVVVGPRCRLAWRILDTQHFNLPQRRRRVFVVGSFGDGPDPVRILFEPKGVSGAAAPGRRPREDVAPTLSARTRGGGGQGTDFEVDGGLVPVPRLYSAMPMNSGRDFTVREVPVAQPIMAAGPGLGDQGGDFVVQPVVGTQGAGSKSATTGTLQDAAAGLLLPLAFGGNNTAGPIEVATARSAHSGPHGRLDFESETFLVQERLAPLPFDTTQITSALNRSAPAAGDPCHPLTAAGHAPAIAYCPETANTLKADGFDGFDGSEDGTGRQPALVVSAEPICFNARQDPDCRTGVAGPLDTDGYTNAIAFSAKDYGGDASVGDTPTLRAGGFTGSHANAGVMPAIAFSLRGRDGENQVEPEEGGVAPALRTGDGGSSKSFVATVTDAIVWAVRRLLPVECERLQGTADNFTKIPWRGKPAEACPDGPRYKVIGNSMSVDVIIWLGDRIKEACS